MYQGGSVFSSTCLDWSELMRVELVSISSQSSVYKNPSIIQRNLPFNFQIFIFLHGDRLDLQNYQNSCFSYEINIIFAYIFNIPGGEVLRCPADTDCEYTTLFRLKLEQHILRNHHISQSPHPCDCGLTFTEYCKSTCIINSAWIMEQTKACLF